MQEALWIGIGVVVAGVAAGAFLRRYRLLLGLSFQMLASVFARLLGAVALGWGITQLLANPSAPRVAAAAALCFVALSMILSAAIVLYALWSEARHPPDAASS